MLELAFETKSPVLNALVISEEVAATDPLSLNPLQWELRPENQSGH